MNILKLCTFGDTGFCRECGATWVPYSDDAGCDCEDDL